MRERERQRGPRGSAMRAMEAEYFTSLAAEVERFVQDGKSRLLITSAGPGEGKSTVSAGLGRALARSGRMRVVVVDTDHLRPTQHRLFATSNERGLGEYLRDLHSLELPRERSEFGLGDWLELLRIQNRSGRLRVTEDEEVFGISVHHGAVVGVTDERAPEDRRLGSLLVRQGQITESQRDNALKLHQESHRPMGDVLLRLGLAELEEVHLLLRAQATERLRQILSLRQPECVYQEVGGGPAGPGLVPALAGDGAGIDTFVGQRIRDYFKRPYLTGRIASYLKDTEFTTLKLMTSGVLPFDLVDRTTAGPFESLLAQLAKSFDVVLVDAPPVAVASPAESIAMMVDGTLFVVKSDGYEVQIVQRAKTQLEKRGALLLGAVLNQVDLSQADPMLHYYYAYSAARR